MSDDQERMQQMIGTINDVVSKRTGLTSRWNGTVSIDPDSSYMGVKNPDCSIGLNPRIVSTLRRFTTGTHEVVHAHSVGLLEPSAYIHFKGYEEGVVEMTARLVRRDVLEAFDFEPDQFDFTQYDTVNVYNGYIGHLEELCVEAKMTAEDFYLGLLKTPLKDREQKIIAWVSSGAGEPAVQTMNRLRHVFNALSRK